MHHLISILSKPDNVPIVLMLVLTIFYTWHSMSRAARNDRQGSPDEAMLSDKVQVWPYLVKVEFLAALLVMGLLTVWSITLNAPLEAPANPSLTPNPSKAPWYFLGLQEILVYFDPWIAGVTIPSLIILGLCAIPYIDVNPKGNGYYTFRERRFAILTFCFGFLVLWVSLIVLGTFFRGPGWNLFMPWEEWDTHRVVALTTGRSSSVCRRGGWMIRSILRRWLSARRRCSHGSASDSCFTSGSGRATWCGSSGLSAIPSLRACS
jgi:hypothetical protein